MENRVENTVHSQDNIEIECRLELLPEELMVYILSYLGILDRVSISQISPRLNQITRCKSLWSEEELCVSGGTYTSFPITISARDKAWPVALNLAPALGNLIFEDITALEVFEEWIWPKITPSSVKDVKAINIECMLLKETSLLKLLLHYADFMEELTLKEVRFVWDKDEELDMRSREYFNSDSDDEEDDEDSEEHYQCNHDHDDNDPWVNNFRQALFFDLFTNFLQQPSDQHQQLLTKLQSNLKRLTILYHDCRPDKFIVDDPLPKVDVLMKLLPGLDSLCVLVPFRNPYAIMRFVKENTGTLTLEMKIHDDRDRGASEALEVWFQNASNIDAVRLVEHLTLVMSGDILNYMFFGFQMPSFPNLKKLTLAFYCTKNSHESDCLADLGKNNHDGFGITKFIPWEVLSKIEVFVVRGCWQFIDEHSCKPVKDRFKNAKIIYEEIQPGDDCLL